MENGHCISFSRNFFYWWTEYSAD